MERGYQLAKDHFEMTNRRVVNATPHTKLDIFDKVNYNNLFKDNK